MIMTPMVEPGFAREIDHEVHSEAEQIAQEGAELAKSLNLDAAALAVADEGDVADTILRVAGEQQAAAIVVGSRGLSGLRARLEGSTSKALLEHRGLPGRRRARAPSTTADGSDPNGLSTGYRAPTRSRPARRVTASSFARPRGVPVRVAVWMLVDPAARARVQPQADHDEVPDGEQHKDDGPTREVHRQNCPPIRAAGL